jgi:hypothetical protein
MSNENNKNNYNNDNDDEYDKYRVVDDSNLVIGIDDTVINVIKNETIIEEDVNDNDSEYDDENNNSNNNNDNDDSPRSQIDPLINIPDDHNRYWKQIEINFLETKESITSSSIGILIATDDFKSSFDFIMTTFISFDSEFNPNDNSNSSNNSTIINLQTICDIFTIIFRILILVMKSLSYNDNDKEKLPLLTFLSSSIPTFIG